MRTLIRMSELSQGTTFNIILLLVSIFGLIDLKHELWSTLVSSKVKLLALSGGVLSLLLSL